MRSMISGLTLGAALLSGCIREVDVKETDLGVFPPDGAMALRGEVPIMLHGEVLGAPQVVVDINGKSSAAVCAGADPVVCELPGGNHFGAPSTIEVTSDAGVDYAEVTTLVPVGEAMAMTGEVDVEKFGRMGIGKSSVADALAKFNLVGVLADTVVGPAFLAGGGEPVDGVVELAEPGLTTVLPVIWDGVTFTSVAPTDTYLPSTSDGKTTQLRFLELEISGLATGDGFDYVLSGVLHPDAWLTLAGTLDLSSFEQGLILDVDTDGDGKGDTVSLRYSGYAEDVSLLEWL